MSLRFVSVFFAIGSVAFADPLITSWSTQNSGIYARVYTSTANRSSGTTSKTWNTSGSTLPHSAPSYSDVYEVSSSSSWVYVKYTGLASYVTGPWLNPQGQAGTLWPGTQAGLRRFPRVPQVQSGTKDSVAAGTSGLFVNGVAAFNSLDGKAWDGSQIQGGAQHTSGTYYWHQVAPVAEGFNFDYSLGHQTPGGLYHNHQNPIGLRYQLGDHVDYNSSSKVYSESASAVTAHSPIIGWAHDGYPIYGPYGYGTATDASSGVRRMVSGYVKRNGSAAGVDNVTTNTTTSPAWYVRYRTAHNLTVATLPARPTDTSTYPIGNFAQDYSYLGDLIKTGSTHYAQGTDFDLDEYNGRTCVTPEYPGGIYAYFTTIDSSGAATYPYVFAFEFYGDASGGSVSSITESVTNQFTGGPDLPITFPNTPTASGGSVTLTWSSAEGSTYTVENSTNQSSWNTQATDVGATAKSTTTSSTFTTIGNSGTEYGRVTRTALATYDTTGVGSATVAQTGTGTYNAGENFAPTLTTISTLSGAVKNNPFTITSATLAAAADEADANGDAISFRIEAVSSGALTKNGAAVSASSTLISSGDSVVWTPAVNFIGTTTAFTVKAHDGALASSTAVAVMVTVIDGNSPPTLTAINTLPGATEEMPFTISYATLIAAADEADLDGDTISFRIETVSGGTLTKDGVAVTPGNTLISTGDSVVWTPATDTTGTLAAFTVKAFDGITTSPNEVTVNVTTTDVNDAPTLTTISTISSAVKNTAFTISYATLAGAADEADVDGDALSFRIEAVSGGTLTKNSAAVTAGTLLASGESLAWTPATNATGTLAAFTVKAYDGALASSTAVQVNVSVAASVPDSQLTSWFTANTGKYARLSETDAELTAGTTKTTWTRTSGPNTITQANPVYAGVTQIDYSASWVYFRTPSLATYNMGPWYNNAARTQLFVNIPKNQGLIVRIPRTSTLGAIPSTKTATMGYMVGGVLQDAIGFLVDGVSIFDPLDGYTYNGGTETMGGAGQWHRDAYVNEGITFDKSLAHQQNTGKYHNHANPIGLRYQLGDAVSFDDATKSYSETMSLTQHSPIIGWMHDGLPIYGPYGYSSALDATSGVRRMIGGFVIRDGATNGADNIATAGRTVPAWALRNGAIQVAGPAVSGTYPLGRYIEDWAYLGDLIKTGTTHYAQGTDFDLNEYNVRYCVTPEFPGGTYAYFLNITSAGTPQFPYMCNRWFFGTPKGSTVTSISESVTNQFTGGPNRPLTVAPDLSGTTITLTWNAVEGGTYSVEASTNGTSFTNKATGLTVTAANSKTTNYTALGTTGTEYARVNRTALATYDTAGTASTTVSQTTTTTVTFPNNAPTLTTINTLTGAGENIPFTINYATLAAAADEADIEGGPLSFRIESVSSGTLTKNGSAVSEGSTLLASGESLVWTPPADSSGILAAFTVRAWDGALASSNSAQVNVDVTSAANLVAVIAVEQPAGTALADGGGRDLGTVLIGGSTDMVFTIKSAGTNLVTLSGTPEVAVSGSPDFTVTAQPASPLYPNGSTTFTVHFAPTSTGLKSASLSIASNDTGRNPFDITLTATARLAAAKSNVLFAKGADAPGRGSNGLPSDAVLATFHPPATDDDGDVAFVATWTSAGPPASKGTGLFLNDKCLAIVGGDASAIGDASAKWKSFSDPVVSAGHAACIAKLSTGASAVVANLTGAALEQIAASGDPATTDGAKFKSFSAVEVQGSRVAFLATLSISTTPKVTAANALGVWLHDGAGSLTVLLRKGDDLDGDVSKTLDTFKAGNGSPGMGRGWFQAGSDGPAALAHVKFTTGGEAVLLGRTTGVDEPALSAQANTGIAGANFRSFGLPARNAAQMEAFRATLALAPDVVTAADASAIFLGQELGVGTPFDYAPVARLDAPAGATGAKFTQLKDPVLAADGALAFPATISARGLAATTLWWKPAGQPLALLAQGGSDAGDLPGAKWKSFSSLAIAANRGPIFAATLVPNTTNVTTASASGVWATDFDNHVRLLFRTGDKIGGKTVKSFTLLKAAVGSTGVTRSFNSAQQVVWLATFKEDKSQAIVTTEVP